MAYADWSVIANEIPTTTKWNILGSNDSSFNDGSGLTGAGIVAGGGVGFIGYATDTGSRSTTNTTDATSQAISALTSSFTAVTSAIYRVIVNFATSNAAGNNTIVQIWQGTVGSGTKKAQGYASQNTTNYIMGGQSVTYTGTLTAGATTVNIGFITSGGTGSVRGDQQTTVMTIDRIS